MASPPAPPDPAVNGRCEPGTLLELFARFQAELLGTLFCLLGNMEDARDALQETFIKCWRHQDKLAEIENPKAWIFQIALNTGRDLRGAAWRALFFRTANIFWGFRNKSDNSLVFPRGRCRMRGSSAELRPV